PAGTNHKISYDTQARNFIVEQKAGKDRIIDFLPYPANYGFIPSTRLAKEMGGDGDALDVLVLAESLPSAVSIEVLPLAIIHLLDRGEVDDKIIAIPRSAERRVIQDSTYLGLQTNYPAVLQILELWLGSYDPQDSTQIMGWGDEEEAWSVIRKSIQTKAE
ncbi:MAG: inorganic diphosphatase, partial [Bacteroidota bacterium]